MLLTGGGDARVLALSAGVVFAHQALQLGKFADHVGQQIRLAQTRRTPGFLHIGTDERRKLGGDARDARDALGLGAELFVEHDVLELGQPVFEPRLEIGLIEELRVGKTRADHALVAGDDRAAAVLRLDVGDENEFVGKRSCFTSPWRGEVGRVAVGWG